MAKVIITGGNGGLATVLAQTISSHHILTTTREGQNASLALDLDNIDDFDYSVIELGDVVLMLAAVSSPHICATQYEMAYRVNTTNSTIFIQKCIDRGAHVIFFSSDNVYAGGDKVYDENSECEPSSIYGRMKLEVEQNFAKEPYFKSFRLSYILYLEDSFSKYLKMICKIDGVAEIYQPFIRSCVSIQDLTLATKQLINNWEILPASILNICGSMPVERAEVAKAFKENYDDRLNYIVDAAPDAFYQDRQAKIKTSSLFLKKILGRDPLTLSDSFSKTNYKDQEEI